MLSNDTLRKVRLKVSLPWICQHNQSKMPKNDARQKCHQVHSVTGNDIRLCLFDRFDEGNNTSSEIESLRKIRCVLELSGMFNNEVEKQLHLKLDSNKIF